MASSCVGPVGIVICWCCRVLGWQSHVNLFLAANLAAWWGQTLSNEEKNNPWQVYPTRPAGTGILQVGNFWPAPTPVTTRGHDPWFSLVTTGKVMILAQWPLPMLTQLCVELAKWVSYISDLNGLLHLGYIFSHMFDLWHHFLVMCTTGLPSALYQTTLDFAAISIFSSYVPLCDTSSIFPFMCRSSHAYISFYLWLPSIVMPTCHSVLQLLT